MSSKIKRNKLQFSEIVWNLSLSFFYEFQMQLTNTNYYIWYVIEFPDDRFPKWQNKSWLIGSE